MVTIQNHAVRIELGISYQWAIDTQRYAVDQCDRIHSAITRTVDAGITRAQSAITATRERAIDTRETVSNAVIDHAVKGRSAARQYATHGRDSIASALLGVSTDQLAQLRDLAINPPAVREPESAVVVQSPRAVRKQNHTVVVSKPVDGIAIDGKTLRQAVEKLGKIAKGSNWPILNYLLFTPGADTVKITANNLDIGMELSIPAGITSDQPFTIECKKLLATLKGVTGEVQIIAGPESAEIHTNTKTVSLPTLATDDYPALPQEFGVLQSANGLLDAVKSVSSAISKDESRQIITGVLLTNNKAIATDTYRLHIKEYEDLGIWPDNIIMPCSLDYSKLLGSENVEIALGNTGTMQYIGFRTGDTLITVRLIEGTYPDYTRVSNVEASGTWQVESSAIIPAIDSLMPVAKEAANRITLTQIDAHTLRMVASSDGSTVQQEIAIEGSEDTNGYTCSFNGQYMKDAILSFAGQTAKLLLPSNPHTAFRLEANGGQYAILMPMNKN